MIRAVRERSCAVYATRLLERSTMRPVPLTAVTGLYLTLADHDTGTIINGRNRQDVRNQNGVFVDPVSGELRWWLAPADNVLVDDARGYELHRALFEVFTTGGFTPRQVDFRVRNLRHV